MTSDQLPGKLLVNQHTHCGSTLMKMISMGMMWMMMMTILAMAMMAMMMVTKMMMTTQGTNVTEHCH